jgi:peptide/nickel transport system substrate-binding protein
MAQASGISALGPIFPVSCERRLRAPPAKMAWLSMQTRYDPVPLYSRRLGPVAALCLLTLAGGLVPIGCSRRSPSPAGSQALRIGTQNTPEALNVFSAMLTAESLLGLDSHGRAMPRLASKWQWLNNGRALSISLRPDVQFHDGTPVTAAAVAAILRKNIPTDGAQGFRYLTSIETPNALSLTFHLSQPDAFLVEAIAGTLILDETRPNIRTGPFKIISSHPVLVAEKNIAYYRGAPGIDKVEVTFFDTQRAVFAAMMRGSLDMVPQVNPESVEFLEGASQFETFPSVRQFYIPLIFNVRHPILQNVEVRRALVQAIDREEIVRQAMRGHARTAEDPIWPSHWAYSGAAKGYAYDPAAARARLDAAGFPVRPATRPDTMASRFQLNCLFYNKDFQFERIAMLLQRQLEEVGVDLVLTGVDPLTLTKRAKTGDFDSYVFQLRSGTSFDWTYRFWHSDGGFQSTGYSGANTVLDDLRRSYNDADVRIAMVNLRQRFYEDVPAAFLAWPETTRAVDARFDIGDKSEPEVLSNIWQWHAGTEQKAQR